MSGSWSAGRRSTSTPRRRARRCGARRWSSTWTSASAAPAPSSGRAISLTTTSRSTRNTTRNMAVSDRARVLVEALPYIRRYSGRTFVIKYGGAAMVDETLKQNVMADLVLMHYVGLHPFLVHGGGPEITEAMKRLGKEATFVNGLRVTDQ